MAKGLETRIEDGTTCCCAAHRRSRVDWVLTRLRQPFGSSGTGTITEPLQATPGGVRQEAAVDPVEINDEARRAHSEFTSCRVMITVVAHSSMAS